MPSRLITISAVGASAMLLAACANDGSALLTTGSLAGSPAKTAKAKVDPVCDSLRAKINALRSEGTPARVEKVATGKSKTVVIKRDALAKMTALDKAQSEFTAKCSRVPPPAFTANAPASAVAAAKKATAPNVVAKTKSANAPAAKPVAKPVQ